MDELSFEDEKRILSEVLRGKPAPPDESPEARRAREHYRQEVEEMRRLGAVVDIPPD